MKILLYIVFSSSYLYELLKALNTQGLKYAFKPRFIFPRLCTRKLHCFKAGVCKIRLSGQIWPTAPFLNKVLLEHSLRHSFTYYLWLFCATAAEPSSCKRDYMAWKPKIFNTWSFTEKVCWPCCKPSFHPWYCTTS